MTRLPDPAEMRADPELRPQPPVPKRRRWLTTGSPLTRRILAVNLLAPILLVGGLLYLDRYEHGLIRAELANLRTQGEMLAAAVGEGAVVEETLGFPQINREMASQMVRRLAEPARVRARLFGRDGELLVDSRLLQGGGGMVLIEDLPPPAPGGIAGLVRRAYDATLGWLRFDDELPLYAERMPQMASDYPEVMRSLVGEASNAVRRRPDGTMLLAVAVPVQRYKQVVGGLMLTRSGEGIAGSLFQVRMAIIQMFAMALLVTVLLSMYLAGTIARPIRRLAAAAEHVRRGHGRRHHIPDLTPRGDEIGELSRALQDMTSALWRRMDGIEAFAADVAHEIKNPLTSLRSAVETVARVKDPEQQQRLMGIIQEDVQRLDRLISDISDASRLDAELSRAESQPVPIRRMLEALVEVYLSTAPDGLRFRLDSREADELEVVGIEGRLVQVFRNLIANAVSFSPPGGTIRLSAGRDGAEVVVAVEDDGPGIPENKLDAIFERFYSERPKAEKFGTHSGLGLSISRQIVEAHGGRIAAENRRAPDGAVRGARFAERLPAAEA